MVRWQLGRHADLTQTHGNSGILTSTACTVMLDLFSVRGDDEPTGLG